MKTISLFILIILFGIIPIDYSRAALYIDDTSTTDKGHFALELSFDYYKDIEKEWDPDAEEYTKSISKEKVITASLAFGITKTWEIEIVTPYKFLDDNSDGRFNGLSDIIINTKYRFFEERKIFPSFALYCDIKTDTGNENKSLGTGELNYTLNNIFTKNIKNNIFDLNLGYTFTGGDTDDIFFYSFDISRNLTDKINICSEIYGETTFAGDFDKNIFIWALSLGYQINKMLCFESGVGIGISRVSPDLQVSTTLTCYF